MVKRIVTLMAIAIAAPALADESPAAQPTQEQVVQQFRTDLQAKRADVMAKGLTLTAEQASKFWPLFETFQKEQSAIVDGQIKATQKYAEHFGKLSDAEALEYVNALLDRDAKMHDLRVKWLTKFQTVLSPKMAARAVQLDRRLGQVTQVKLSSEIPLVQ
ncbi:MAG: hypothetical protein ABW110_01915 [Steroidobacteraceae bacterium]